MEHSSDRSGGGEWLAQARRGVVELCVLTLVSRRPYYGYELVSALGRWQQLAVPDGTLYPLLRRLERTKALSAKWIASDAGPARKYYSLTPAGERLLRDMSGEWDALSSAIEAVKHQKEKVRNG